MTERELMLMPEYEEALAQPLFDGPRLRLADTIETRWPDRAALTRLLIQWHRRRHFQQSPTWRPLKRMLELEDRLKPGGPPPFDVAVAGYAHERGLVEDVELSIGSFFADNLQVMRRFPIFYLHVLDCSVEDLRRLAACEALSRLITFQVTAPGVGDEGLRILLDSPHLQNVKVLGVHDAGLTMTGYELVAQATKTTLAGLEVAFLSGNTLPDPHEKDPAFDGLSGSPIYETVGVLPVPGQILEENLGPQKWLHWCTRFGHDFSSRRFERPLDMDETPLRDEDVLTDR